MGSQVGGCHQQLINHLHKYNKHLEQYTLDVLYIPYCKKLLPGMKYLLQARCKMERDIYLQPVHAIQAAECTQLFSLWNY